MLFSLLEAQVKDSIPNAAPKSILRASKRALRQINAIISGEFKTDKALTEVLNDTAFTISFTAATKTIVDDGGTGKWEGVSAGDKIYISGSVSNDGTYTCATNPDDINITVTENIENENAIECTVIVATPATGYDLDFPELTLPSELIRVIKNGVMVDDEVWDARTRDYIKRNVTEEAYNIIARNKILFAATTFLSNVDVVIQGYFGITLPISADISTDIAIPDTWEEAFTAGVIAYLTLDKSYRDEETHKVNQSIFDRMLVAIRTQEKERFTASSVDQEYNYSNPEGK